MRRTTSVEVTLFNYNNNLAPVLRHLHAFTRHESNEALYHRRPDIVVLR